MCTRLFRSRTTIFIFCDLNLVCGIKFDFRVFFTNIYIPITIRLINLFFIEFVFKSLVCYLLSLAVFSSGFAFFCTF